MKGSTAASMFICKIDETLELRLLLLQHATELFTLVNTSREHLRPWMAWVDSIQSAEDSGRFISYSLTNYTQGNGFSAGIWCQQDIVGFIGHVHPIDRINKVARISFWLNPAFEGKGIVTRACRTIIKHSFSEMELNKIELRCAVENKKARAVAKRLNFTEECTLRCGEWQHGQYRDLILYGMLARDWKGEP